MTYFQHRSAAERYALSRPYFHPLVVQRIKEFLNLEEPVEAALDVACGTGQSAVALTEIATKVTATDLSEGMLAQAPANSKIEYRCAPAEELPFAENSFDLLTVSLAFHWFDRTRFLREAARVLRPQGYLVIYNNGFFGRMQNNPAFERWNHDAYLTRYPTPSRNNAPLTEEEALDSGFRFLGRERYENKVTLSAEQLAHYLTTQSNFIAMVEQGAENFDDAYRWLTTSLPPFFSSTAETFEFGGSIWYLQKQ